MAVPVSVGVSGGAAPAAGMHAKLRLLHAAAPTHMGGAAKRAQEAPMGATGRHTILPPHSAAEKALTAPPSPPCRTEKAALGAQAAGVVP